MFAGNPFGAGKGPKDVPPGVVQPNSPPVDLQLTGVIARGVEGSKSKLLACGPTVRRPSVAALAKGDCPSFAAGSAEPPALAPLAKARYGGGQTLKDCGSKMSNGLPPTFAAGGDAVPTVPSALRRNPGTSSSGSRTLKPGPRKLGRTLKNMGAP